MLIGVFLELKEMGDTPRKGTNCEAKPEMGTIAVGMQ